MASQGISGEITRIDSDTRQEHLRTPTQVTPLRGSSSRSHKPPSFLDLNPSETDTSLVDENGIIYADYCTPFSGEPIEYEYFQFKNADVTGSRTLDQSVQGRIAANKEWWFNTLQLSSLVKGDLLNNYYIPLVALNHSNFAAKAIEELISNRCVAEVPNRPYCCNPLSVVE